MKHLQVDFKNSDNKKTTWAMGRNGMMQCHGVSVNIYEDDGQLVVMPINSKGVEGNCFIDMPIDVFKQIANSL